MLVRIWSNQNSHSLLMGMYNGTTTVEHSLKVSYTTEHFLTIQISTCTPCAFTQRSQKQTCLHINLHVGIYSTFIKNCQILEATKTSFSRRKNHKLCYFQAVKYYPTNLKISCQTMK